MSTPEGSHRPPEWEPAIASFVTTAEWGLIPPETIIPSMGVLCMQLVQGGAIANFGEVQTYLRQRSAYVQLIAKPFRREDFPQHPDIRCLDVVSYEPRGHWLMVSVGHEGIEARTQLQNMGMSNDVNETALARDTGMLMAGRPPGL